MFLIQVLILLGYLLFSQGQQCEPDTCTHGVCTPKGSGSLRCTCNPGYVGVYCDLAQQVNTSCYSCACCINGVCSQGDDGQSCDNGCINGHWDDRCWHDCPEHCVSCKGLKYSFEQGYPVRCSKCEDGYYNGRYQDTGVHDLVNCTYACRPNCSSCSSYNYCTACDPGFYGKLCLNCSAGCVHGVCNQLDGACTCNTGWAGEQCDHCIDGRFGEDCSGDCQTNCKVCSAVDDCQECYSGYAGRDCDRCLDGKYGTNCSEDCPVNCQSCTSYSQCSSCKPGFSGSICDTCASGTFGIHCNNSCVNECALCTSNDTCDHCKAGYHGTHCSEVCPYRCLNDECEMFSGNCYYGCKGNYHGPKCEEMCQFKCKPYSGFQSVSSCGQTDGACSFGCTNGYYETNCNKHCSDNCLDMACDWDNGACLNGCILGYTGTFCDQGTTRALTHRHEAVLYAGIGGSLGTLFVVGVVLLVIIYVRRIRSKNELEESSTYVQGTHMTKLC